MHIHFKRALSIAVILGSLLPTSVLSATIIAQSDGGTRQQDFVITAYYSPLPHQCCYVKGSYAADMILNGEGIHGADGTGVYPGMAAAPKSYAFGTRIVLPGIGVVTVHDRGGAINEQKDGTHRLDLWVGHGEEGLARALAFGVRRVKGTIHPVGSAQPPESLALASLPAPLSILTSFMTDQPSLLSVRPKAGERGPSVQLLQEHLRDLGYFSEEPTGFFGAATQESLAQFLSDMQVEDSAVALTDLSAAYLTAAFERKDVSLPFEHIDAESDPRDIAAAQRLLRFTGFYRGRTDGIYDDDLAEAILKLQREEKLADTVQDPGAGRIGPQTRKKLLLRWQRRLVAKRAQIFLALRRIDEHIAKVGLLVEAFVSQGDRGKEVEKLQRFLADRGFFPAEKINGNFGTQTKESLLAYQLSRGIIQKETDAGAGFAGPATLAYLKREARSALYRLVQEKGWIML